MPGVGQEHSHLVTVEGDLAQGASAAFHVINYLVDTHGCPEAVHMEIQLDTEGCSDGVFEGALAQGASAAFHVIGYLVDTRGCPEAGHMETQLDTEGC